MSIEENIIEKGNHRPPKDTVIPDNLQELIESPRRVNLNNEDDRKEYIFEFIKAWLDQDYEHPVPIETLEERLTICKGCEHFNPTKVKCNACGCQLLGKASDAFEVCPEGYWNIDRRSFYDKYYDEIKEHMDLGYRVGVQFDDHV